MNFRQLYCLFGIESCHCIFIWSFQAWCFFFLFTFLSFQLGNVCFYPEIILLILDFYRWRIRFYLTLGLWFLCNFPFFVFCLQKLKIQFIFVLFALKVGFDFLSTVSLNQKFSKILDFMVNFHVFVDSNRNF